MEITGHWVSFAKLATIIQNYTYLPIFVNQIHMKDNIYLFEPANNCDLVIVWCTMTNIIDKLPLFRQYNSSLLIG